MTPPDRGTTPIGIVLVGGSLSRRLLEPALASASWAFELHQQASAQVVAEAAVPTDVDLVVFGPDARQVLRDAQRMREQAPRAQVIFLLPKARLAAFRATLPFVPHMAHAWTADADAGADDLRALLDEAARTTRDRTALRSVFDQINRRLAASAGNDETVHRLRQLARSQEYLATLLQQLPDAFVAADPAGIVVSWNEAATRLWNRPADAAVGRPLADVLPVELAPSIERDWPQALGGQAVSSGELRFADADGVTRWVTISIAPVHDGDEVVSLFVTGHDITDRKRSDSALRDLNATLEAKVRQRTDELQVAESNMRHAQKMEAVGQLTGGIAHDFNNLLQGIVGSIELAQRRVDAGRTDGIGRLLTGAMTSAKRAASLTHRLLAFSRRQPLDPTRVEANALIASMEDLLVRTLGEHVALALVFADDLWPTLCDGNQLEGAILNLAINARDAMPDGGRLVIETANAEVGSADAARVHGIAPGSYVCVTVTDSGSGMSAETIERAFDPFFTTKPIGQGTGLGLSMVYGFARQSEGHVRIDSELGIGTSMRIYLPRQVGLAPAHVEALAGTTAIAHDASGTIAVIEDEEIVRSLVVEVLRGLGYATIEANDGPSGLALVQSDVRIDLVITDIGLPGMNGRQVADAARAHRPGLPIVMMTGYAENAATARGMLEPGMSLITKPFAIDALVERVSATLSSRR